MDNCPKCGGVRGLHASILEGCKCHWTQPVMPWNTPGTEYERGFIDGMQKQMQSSVDKAVNGMAKREWVELMDHEVFEIANFCKGQNIFRLAQELSRKLKEKNNG